MVEINVFKAFKEDLTNKYGQSFEVGVVYSKSNRVLKFGKNGSGYHVSVQLADTFRFFNPCRDNVYCEVVGFGNMVQQDNYLYRSDTMYVVEKMKIIKIMTREDIFRYVLHSSIDEFRRFLALYPFNKEELELLKLWVLEKNEEYKKLFYEASLYQTGDSSSFKRNPKYLRRF